MNLTIRKAKIKDLDDLVEIEKSAFDQNYYYLISKSQFNYLLTKANAEIWLAFQGEVKCGMIVLLYRKNSHYARLYSISVLPDFQGRGIGNQLMAHGQKSIIAKGLKEIRQEVRSDNKKLIKKYKKDGFKIYVKQSKYYPDGVSCCKLKKNLNE